MRRALALALCLAAGTAAADDVSALFGGRVSADARFKPATADFDGDGKTDALYLVSLAPGPLAKDVTVADRLFDTSANGRARTALAFTMGNGRKFLVTDGSFFATPIWSEAPVPLGVAKRGSADFKSFAAQEKRIVHDVVVLGTEAGIDIALYWNGKGFAVFWPAEEP